jgi:RNA polymerase sigma-70 factor, ECF subfamily
VIHPEARCAHDDLAARLRPFIARRVTPGDVDDVLQDVFVRVQRGLGGLRDEERFGPWMYRVARSAIAEHRRVRRRHPLADGEAADLPDEPLEHDEETEGERALALAVVPFIAMLPSPYREALTLTELEGVSQKDAAEMVGISVSGMKSRVQRGRSKLREMFEACCKIALDARGRVISCEPRSRSSKCAC